MNYPNNDIGIEDSICQWVYSGPKFNNNGKVNRKRKRIGLVVAEKLDGVIHLGWSKCSSHDKFDLERAREIAYGRLITGTNMALPASFKHFMPDFILRCKKYYKVDEVVDFSIYTEVSYWDDPKFDPEHDHSQCCDCDCADEDETEFYNNKDVVK